jgi:zinc D-Ala-D-Ala carboxypeptidase
MPEYSTQQIREWLERLRSGVLELNDDNMGLADATLVLLGFDRPMPEPLPPGYITPHFTLKEMCVTFTGLANFPNSSEVENIQQTAGVLEKIRTILNNNPITVTSAFRSEPVNQAVGGVPNSAHRLGLAADFVCPGFGSPHEISLELKPHIAELGLDQLIYENKGGAEWVHVGLSDAKPRHMALTITDSGTFNGIV